MRRDDLVERKTLAIVPAFPSATAQDALGLGLRDPRGGPADSVHHPQPYGAAARLATES